MNDQLRSAMISTRPWRIIGMQDRELYAQILGIERPWHVREVQLRLSEGEVDIFLEHEADVRWPCPQCGVPCTLYDHLPVRRWRHLDTCQYRTIIHASQPRGDCPEHGALAVRLPWAEPNSRFTNLFEALAIDWLSVASQSGVARLLRLSWDEVHAIMDRAKSLTKGARTNSGLLLLDPMKP